MSEDLSFETDGGNVPVRDKAWWDRTLAEAPETALLDTMLARYPDLKDGKPAEKPKAEPKAEEEADPVQEAYQKFKLVGKIMGQVEAIDGLTDEDTEELEAMLIAKGVTAASLRDEKNLKQFLQLAKGKAAERKGERAQEDEDAEDEKPAVSRQRPAPVTPGAARSSLAPAETQKLRELAVRLNVPFDDLKTQYAARKRQSA